jgi:prepilin peptidase CpaA
LTTRWPEPTNVIASIYFIFACAFDTIKAKIPNILNAGLAIAGPAFFFHTAGWTGLLTSLAGLVLGLGLLLLPWLMGGMGAGDVKALGALGALLGPRPLLHVFIYMGLIGGIMAILHYLFERNLKEKAAEWLHTIKATVLTNDPNMIVPSKTETLRFPYAAAIAFGYYTYLSFGGVF